jgi:hypothetical protein
MPPQYDFNNGGFFYYDPEWEQNYFIPYGQGAHGAIEIPQEHMPEGVNPYQMDRASQRSFRDLGYDLNEPIDRDTSWDWDKHIQNLQGYYPPQQAQEQPAPQAQVDPNSWQQPPQQQPPQQPAQPVVPPRPPAPPMARPGIERNWGVQPQEGMGSQRQRERANLSALDPAAVGNVAQPPQAPVEAPRRPPRTPEEREAQHQRDLAEYQARQPEREEWDRQHPWLSGARDLGDRAVRGLGGLLGSGLQQADRGLGNAVNYLENAPDSPMPLPMQEGENPEQNAQRSQEQQAANEAHPYGMDVSPQEQSEMEAYEDPLFEYNEPYQPKHHDWDWNDIKGSISNKWNDFRDNAKEYWKDYTPGEIANKARREYARYQMLSNLPGLSGPLKGLLSYLGKRGALHLAENEYDKGGKITDTPLAGWMGDAFQRFAQTGIGNRNAETIRNLIGGAAGGAESLAHEVFPTANEFWNAQSSGNIGSALAGKVGRLGGMGMQALYDYLQRNTARSNKELYSQRRAANPNYRVPRRADFPANSRVFSDYDQEMAAGI